MLPTFLIAGAAKAGTTSLYHYMREHPDIYMPALKELHYFTRNYERGRQWYERHFAGWRGESAIGEASPSYISVPEAPERIAALVPSARLIFILRDPVERAYSHYWFYISRGAQDARESFTEAIRTPRGYRCYVERGFYAEQLARFLPYFRREDMLILITEDLKADAAAMVARCYEFVGVRSDFRTDVSRAYNAARLPARSIWGRCERIFRRTARRAKRFTPDLVKNGTRHLREAVHARLFRPAKLPAMSAEDRAYLQELYAPHTEALSRFLERDLFEVWQRPAGAAQRVPTPSGGEVQRT